MKTAQLLQFATCVLFLSAGSAEGATRSKFIRKNRNTPIVLRNEPPAPGQAPLQEPSLPPVVVTVSPTIAVAVQPPPPPPPVTDLDLRVRFLINLYQNILERAPDVNGLLAWAEIMDTATRPSCAATAASFIQSQEFAARSPTLSTTTFVTALYQGLLSRAPDQGGISAWRDALDSNSVTRSQAVDGFLKSPEFDGLCKGAYGFPEGAGNY